MRSSDPAFAAFILTHGRPDKVVTYESLRRQGYTGRIVVVIDDEDSTGDEYRRRFGDEVVVFDKKAVARTFDAGDLSDDRRAVVYARVAAFDIARELGISHFIQLDDDYSSFAYRIRVPRAKEDWELRIMRSRKIWSMDRVLDAMLDLLEETGALTVAMAQGGEMIGGVAAHVVRQGGWKRKAMNSFLVRTDRPIPFVGRLNEDVNAYCLGGMRGDLYMTVSQLCVTQGVTQSRAGGMTETYLDSGTFIKSFYTVMMCPSFVRIDSIGPTDRRMHHHISWEHAVPKLLDEKYRRDDGDPGEERPEQHEGPPTPMLDASPAEGLRSYLSLLSTLPDVDTERVRAVALDQIRRAKAKSSDRESMPPSDMEQRWYASLDAGAPDWGIYDSDDYLGEAWACWVAYSRIYLRSLRWPRLNGRPILSALSPVASVLDLGCGHGYSTAGLRELFPDARVIGTQLPGRQKTVAEMVGREHGFDVVEGIEGIGHVDLVFASEYWEHLPDPIEGLRALLDECSPRFLLLASTFNQRSPGHFPVYGPERMDGRRTGAAFAAFLEERGYRMVETRLWNGTPQFWRAA